jgi:predicted  nucleic acid-binding Zn-ribbon protein
MTEDKFPHSAPVDHSSQEDLDNSIQAKIQEAIIVTDIVNDNVDDGVKDTDQPSQEQISEVSLGNDDGEISSSILNEQKESKEVSEKNKLYRSNPTLGNLSIRQLDQEFDPDGDQENVAQNTDWFTLARKLRQHNRELVKTVVQLEQALADTQEALQIQIMRSKSADVLIEQQNEELNNTQKQISRLFSELETSHQTAQRQQTLLDHITQQLQEAQEQTAHLERECALLQESHNEQSHKLIEAEKQIRQLRDRLHQQQRETLQYKSNFQEVSEIPIKQKTSISPKINPQILEEIKEESPSPNVISIRADIPPVTEEVTHQENLPKTKSSVVSFSNPHKPIQPWSSTDQGLPLPLHIRLNLAESFPTKPKQNESNLNNNTLNSDNIEKKTPQIPEFKTEIKPSNQEELDILSFEDESLNPQEKEEGIILPFPKQKGDNQSAPNFPSFNIKSTKARTFYARENLNPLEQNLNDNLSEDQAEKKQYLDISDDSLVKEKLETSADDFARQSEKLEKEIDNLDYKTRQLSEKIENIISSSMETENLDEEDINLEFSQSKSEYKLDVSEIESEKEVSPPEITPPKTPVTSSNTNLPRKRKTAILLPLEFPKDNLRQTFIPTQEKEESPNQITDKESQRNTSLFTSLREKQGLSAKSPSPLIHPLRSHNTKKSSRRIILPTFS